MTAEILSDEHEKDAASDLIAEAIGAAEDVLDPLKGLIERSASDPGAAFTPTLENEAGNPVAASDSKEAARGSR
jgi:hypothetical protein